MLDVLVSQHYFYLTQIAKRISGDKELAVDLVSDTYINLHDKQTKLPEDDREFISYFSRCMFNLNIDRLRKKASELNISFSEIPDTPKWYLLVEIENFKNTLSDLDQILFELCYEFHQLSSRDIAQMLSEKMGYRVSHKLINNLISPLRDKIKEKKWNGLTSWEL